VASSTIKLAIQRIRPHFYEGMKSRWWKDRQRPKPLNQAQFEHIALIVDSNSVEVYRPRAPFNEAKVFFH